jgi:methylase of polypeptide subunit release factors
MIKTGELLGHNPGETQDDLSIIDVCTGTGCIPLLLYATLRSSFHHLHIRGVDIAPEAVDLAKLNIRHNTSLGNIEAPTAGARLDILRGDIFNDKDAMSLAQGSCDILVSNPPYVSQKSWDCGHGQLGYSVRKYEPRLALVPCHDLPIPPGWRHEDVFYARLLDFAMLLKPRASLFELGGELQARRVLGRLFRHKIAELITAEIWRDWPDLSTIDGEAKELVIEAEGISRKVPIKGSGQIRSIFLRLR